MGKAARKKTLTKQQRLRRVDGRIVRVEVALNADKTGDVFIADYLNELPPGTTKSDYFRAALLDKILTERRETDTDVELRRLRETVYALEDQNAALVDMVRDLMQSVQELAQREITVEMVQAAQVRVGPPKPETIPEQPQISESSGLDMSRPRPRAKLQRGPVTEAIDVTEEFDPVALGKLMAQSIKNAQPGRKDGR